MGILAAVLVAIDTLCYTGQTFANKLFSMSYPGPERSSTGVFSVFYGAIVALGTLAYMGFHYSPDILTLIFGILNGICLFMFNLGSIKAAVRGPYSFQSMVAMFGSSIVPVLFCALWWGDRMTGLQILGVCSMMVALVLFNLKGLGFMGIKKGYFLWVAVLFTTNGFYAIVMDAQQRIVGQQERGDMIITLFLTTAVISAINLVIAEKKNCIKIFKMPRRSAIFMIISSCCAAVAVNLLMVLLGMVPAGILYTIIDGGIIALSTILSVVVLRERLEWQMTAGIIVAVISIVFLGI